MAELTIEAALKQAIEAHKAGKLQDADKLYTAILKSQPQHPEANHNMGILAVSVGKASEGLPFFRAALAAKPGASLFWHSYINTLIELGRLTDANAVLVQAKRVGVKGDGFDRFEQQLSGSDSKPIEVKEPSQDQLWPLVHLYNQGELQQALNYAVELLWLFPNSVTLHNICGAIHAGLYHYDAAIDSYNRALKIKPDFADAYCNMGHALRNKGDLDAAIAGYKQALKLKPKYIEAHASMANTLKQKGDLDAAICSYKLAIKLHPDNASTFYNMGNAFMDKGELDAAIDSYKSALKLEPDFADAYYNMGNALRVKGSLGAAIDSYKRALKLKPDFADAYNNMGTTLKDHGEINQAIDSYKRALKLKPDFADAHNNMGLALVQKDDLGAAMESYKWALTIKPDFAEANNNMGIALMEQGEFDAAIDSYKRALQLKPDYVDAHNTMGLALVEGGDLDAAMESYKRAVMIDPHHADAHHNMSLELLKDQKFEQGFKLNEWRWKAKTIQSIGTPLKTSKPLWGGEKNKTVFVWGEQGIGDEIMFASLIPELYAISSKLIVQCDKRLIPLLQRSFPKDITYQSDRSLVTEDSYDFHTPIGSLARVFRTSLDSFQKTSDGYLCHDEAKTNRLRQELLMGEVKTLIGISWKTTSALSNSNKRNIALPELAQVLNSSETRLVCLQYGDVSEEIDLLKKEFGIDVMHVSEIDNRNDIDGLASLIMACDKIVSTTNATVHLAGALGAATKVLVPFFARWIWGRTLSHSPWYSSVTVYRQNRTGDWGNVLNALSKGMKTDVNLEQDLAN